MRDFFIRSFERLIGLFIVIGAIVILVAAVAAALGSSGGGEGLLTALGILIGGGLYLVLVGGFAYLGLGIYHNTRRAAEALERQEPRP